MTMAARVRHALRPLNDPCSVASGTPIDVVSMGLVKDVNVDEAGTARVEIRLTSPSCVMLIRLGEAGYFTRMRQKLNWGDLSEREIIR